MDAVNAQALGRAVDPRDPKNVRQTAAQMVSELFFGPMLAQMRKFPFGSEIGSGGRGEEVFGEQLDRKLADAVASAQGGPLIRRLEAQLQNRALVELRTQLGAQRELAEARHGRPNPTTHVETP